jgi:hypothetical protein
MKKMPTTANVFSPIPVNVEIKMPAASPKKMLASTTDTSVASVLTVKKSAFLAIVSI